jgi:hypothetical protein
VDETILGRCGELKPDRMDELDHMYDDMQDRLYEIDKNRKVTCYINPRRFFFNNLMYPFRENRFKDKYVQYSVCVPHDQQVINSSFALT